MQVASIPERERLAQVFEQVQPVLRALVEPAEMQSDRPQRLGGLKFRRLPRISARAFVQVLHYPNPRVMIARSCSETGRQCSLVTEPSQLLL